MKISKTLQRMFLAIVSVATCVAGFADPAMARNDDLVAVDVLQDDARGLVLHFEFGDFQKKTVRVNGQPYTSIHLGNESHKMEPGVPSLPDVRRSVIIPNMADMDVIVIDGDFIDIEDMDIVPSKGSILRTVNPSTVPWNFGPAYESKEFWPGDLATLGEPYIMRSKRGVVVTVNPFQYNPSTRTLRVYQNMTVAVDNVGNSRTNVLAAGADKHDGGSTFHTIYSNHFLNYHRDARSNPIVEEGSLLIIAADQFMANMSPFVDHKVSIGIDTALVPLSNVGSSWQQIHSYIGDMYDATDLVYVLLVGDASHIPASTSAGGLSDPNYTKQEGSDDYPDIVIGRFSCNNSAQLDTQVDRTITYEADQWTLKAEYFNAQGASSNQGPGDEGEYDHEHMAVIGEKYLAWDVVDWSQESDPSGSIGDFIDGWNAGIGHIQYTGHGWSGGWSNGAPVENSHVNSLTNTTMLPYIVTVGCVVGDYSGGDCFCEATQWATHNGQPTGAIAHYGSTINQYWSEPMRGQDAMVDLMVDETYFTMGALCFMGSVNMVDAYGQSGIDMLDTWHIFGDPSVIISGTAQPPTGMRVSGSNLVAEGPSGGPFLPSATTYTIQNNEDYSIDYQVSEESSWLDIVGSDTGTLPPQGSAELTININGSANSLPNGLYEASIEFTNLYNNDGNIVKPATLTVGTPQPVYTWDLSEDPGWSMQGEWGFGQPAGGGGGSFGLPDPTSGATDNYVLGVNLNGDYSTNVGGPYYLTSEAFDCSNLTDTSFTFMRWLNTDYQPYVSATIEASNDGVSWTMLWENGSSGEITANSWSEHEFDISALADSEPYVQVRWTYEVTSGAWAYSGWNIDDVVVSAVDSSSPPCSGDINGDGDVGVDDLLAVIAGWGDPYTVDDLLNVIGGWGGCDEG